MAIYGHEPKKTKEMNGSDSERCPWFSRWIRRQTTPSAAGGWFMGAPPAGQALSGQLKPAATLSTGTGLKLMRLKLLDP